MKKWALMVLMLMSQMALAKDMFFEWENISDVIYEAPSYHAFYEWCHEDMMDREIFGYEIYRMKSNRPLIDKVVNQDILTREALLNMIEEGFKTAVQEMEQEKKLGNEINRLMWCGQAHHIKPRYLGHTQNREQIAVDWYTYSGGAHGLGGTTYYVFSQDDELIKLNDLIKEESMPDLQSALMKAYFDVKNISSAQEYQKEEHCCIEIKAGESPEDSIQSALLTDNFYFNAYGLNFVYPPYQIASYSEGEITLTLSYEELKDWLK